MLGRLTPWIFGIALVCLLVIGLAWWWHGREQEAVENGLPPSISAIFSCPNGEQIEATFVNGKSDRVDLSFSDGSTMSLPQAVSADGARYANADGSYVFWNVGNTAMVEQNGTTTLSDCVASSTDASD